MQASRPSGMRQRSPLLICSFPLGATNFHLATRHESVFRASVRAGIGPGFMGEAEVSGAIVLRSLDFAGCRDDTHCKLLCTIKENSK